MKKRLLGIYHKLYAAFGSQHWWPADSPFEVAVGAILTQNTSWENVERAIENLRRANCLSFAKMTRLSQKKLASLIRPAGYYNVKAARLKNFLRFLDKNYNGRMDRMAVKECMVLRQELLSVNGIGEETADSILLYALGKSIFVIDAYTRRIFLRHRFLPQEAGYGDFQKFFMRNLRADQKLFNEYHALLVRCAKEFCKKTKERCSLCPIAGINN